MSTTMNRGEKERMLSRSKQKSYRTQVTNIYREREEFANFDVEKLNAYKTKILSYKAALEPLSEMIIYDNYEKATADSNEQNAQAKKDEAEENMAAEYARKIEYEDKCAEILKKLNKALKKFSEEDEEVQEAPSIEEHAAKSALKAPVVSLPVFGSEENEDILLFLTEFEAILAKYTMSAYDKFHLLRKQVKGKASHLLKALSPAQHTYAAAKAVLKEALASRERQVFIY